MDAAGPIERRLPLEGSLGLGHPGATPLEMGLSATGLWLLGAGANGSPLLSLNRARYASHAVRADRLELMGATLSVPLWHKREARELFALGRIRHGSGPLAPVDFSGRYASVVGPVQEAVVSAWLQPGEVLLAALPTADVQTESTLGLDARETRIEGALELFVASDRRLALLAVGELGDWTERGLEAGVLELERRLARWWVRRGAARWRPSGNAERFEELARACALTGGERAIEVCRVAYRHGTEAQRAASERLLRQFASRTDASMAQLLLQLEREPNTAPGEASSALMPDALAQLTPLWQAWQLSEALAERLVRALATLAHARPHALALQRALWERQLEAAEDESSRVRADLVYARGVQHLGANALALDALERRRGVLADLPRLDADRVGPEPRIELLEALLDVAPMGSEPLRQAALELTQLDPMSRGRFACLAEAARGTVAERARECDRVLAAEVLAPRSEPAGPVPTPSYHAIEKALLDSRVRHPLVRGGAPLSALIQRVITASESPDTTLLREHCERLEGSASAAERALADAARVLGIERVEAYISRGERDIGVRAFDAQPAFVLIGGKHTDMASPYQLRYDELCFALGAELAHLRLGHTRSSSSALWFGALDKSRQGVELLIGVLPLLHGWNLAGQVFDAAGSLRHPLVRRIWGAAGLLQGPVSQSLRARLRRGARLGGDLTPPNEELLVAHRLMQLSADRAGLVVSGSLHAAVRAILLTRADYRALERPDPQLSLVAALEEEVKAGSSVFTDLSVRIGALAAFYVSDDYAELRAACCPA